MSEGESTIEINERDDPNPQLWCMKIYKKLV
jgi:hypothetical protein